MGTIPAKRNSSTSRMAFRATAFNISSCIDVVRANQRMPATRRTEAIRALAKDVTSSMRKRPHDILTKAFWRKTVLRDFGIPIAASSSKKILRYSCHGHETSVLTGLRLRVPKIQGSTYSLYMAGLPTNLPTSMHLPLSPYMYCLVPLLILPQRRLLLPPRCCCCYYCCSSSPPPPPPAATTTSTTIITMTTADDINPALPIIRNLP